MKEIFILLNATFFLIICLLANSNSVRLSFLLGSDCSTRNALFAIYSLACVFSAVLFLENQPIFLFLLLTFHALVILIAPACYRFRALRLKGNKAQCSTGS